MRLALLFTGFFLFRATGFKQPIDCTIERAHVRVLQFLACLGAFPCELFFYGFGRIRDWFLHASTLPAEWLEG